MRNIAEILKDDRNGKQLSQTERQIAVAYNQGKYDAVRELKIGNDSNINKVLNKIRAEIEKLRPSLRPEQMTDYDYAMVDVVNDIVAIIDKYKAESEDKG